MRIALCNICKKVAITVKQHVLSKDHFINLNVKILEKILIFSFSVPPIITQKVLITLQ